MISGACGEAALMGVPSLMLCPTLKSGGAYEGNFSELPPELVTYGELVAEEIKAWVVVQAERGAPQMGHAMDDQQRFEKQLDKLLEGDWK